MLVRPMLLHRMALVCVRLFCKYLGNLQEFFGQMVYRPPLTKNCPYAYVSEFANRLKDLEERYNLNSAIRYECRFSITWAMLNVGYVSLF